MAERSEAKSAKRSFVSKMIKIDYLSRRFASRFKLRYAQQFLAKLKRTTNWSFNFKGWRLKFQKKINVILPWLDMLARWKSFLVPDSQLQKRKTEKLSFFVKIGFMRLKRRKCVLFDAFSRKPYFIVPTSQAS